MKTKRYQNGLRLLAMTAAALALHLATATAQNVDSVESLKNRAIAASPRAQEAFPWLGRAPSPGPRVCCVEGTARNELAQARQNRALAASPRMLEQFPELAHPATPAARPEFSIAPLAEKNTAVLSSPRTREEFPGLTRGSTPGTAKGGASRLLESGQ